MISHESRLGVSPKYYCAAGANEFSNMASILPSESCVTHEGQWQHEVQFLQRTDLGYTASEL
jgi:hypothetical protein